MLPRSRAVRDLPVPHARTIGIEEGRGEVLATATMSPQKDFAADVEARVEGARGVQGPLRWRGSATIGASVRGRGLRTARIDGRVAARHLSTCNDQGRCSVAPTADASGEIVLRPDRPAVGRFNVQAGDFALDAGNTTIAATSLAGNAELSSAGCVGDRSTNRCQRRRAEKEIPRSDLIPRSSADDSRVEPLSRGHRAPRRASRARRSIGEPSRCIRRRPRSSRRGTDSN